MEIVQQSLLLVNLYIIECREINISFKQFYMKCISTHYFHGKHPMYWDAFGENGVKHIWKKKLKVKNASMWFWYLLRWYEMAKVSTCNFNRKYQTNDIDIQHYSNGTYIVHVRHELRSFSHNVTCSENRLFQFNFLALSK